MVFCKKYYGYLLVISQICSSSEVNLAESCEADGMEFEEVFENQARKSSLISGFEFSSSFEDLQDHPAFSTADGKPRPSIDNIEPPLLWEWEGPWFFDEKLIGSGEAGWSYAHSWESSNWGPRPSFWTKVRRRRWLRYRKQIKREDSSYMLTPRENLNYLTSAQTDLIDSERIEKFIMFSPSVEQVFSFFSPLGLLPSFTCSCARL